VCHIIFAIHSVCNSYGVLINMYNTRGRITDGMRYYYISALLWIITIYITSVSGWRSALKDLENLETIILFAFQMTRAIGSNIHVVFAYENGSLVYIYTNTHHEDYRYYIIISYDNIIILRRIHAVLYRDNSMWKM